MELVLKDIKKKFDEKEVIKEASFTFEKGKIYGLLGRNGAGKTTLFNCISKDIKIDSGEVKFINDQGKEEELDYSKIGYVFSTPILPDFEEEVMKILKGEE